MYRLRCIGIVWFVELGISVCGLFVFLSEPSVDCGWVRVWNDFFMREFCRVIFVGREVYWVRVSWKEICC